MHHTYMVEYTRLVRLVQQIVGKKLHRRLQVTISLYSFTREKPNQIHSHAFQVHNTSHYYMMFI